MASEEDLKVELTELVAHVKGLHMVLSSVMIDIAALRKTSLNKSAVSATYAKHVKKGAEIARPLIDKAMCSYDEMIRRIGACDTQSIESPEPTPVAKIRLQ